MTELRKIGKYLNHLFMRQSLDSRERQVELVLMCFQHIENVWHLQASPCRYCQPWQRINQRFMGWKVIQQAKGLCMRDPCGTTYLLRSYFVSDRIGKPGSALFFMMDFCCETGGAGSLLFSKGKNHKKSPYVMAWGFLSLSDNKVYGMRSKHFLSFLFTSFLKVNTVDRPSNDGEYSERNFQYLSERIA